MTKLNTPVLPDWSVLERREHPIYAPQQLKLILKALHTGRFLYAVEPIFCALKQRVEFNELLLRVQNENKSIMPAHTVFNTIAQNNLTADFALFLVHDQLCAHKNMGNTASMNIHPLLLSNSNNRQKLWHLLENHAATRNPNKIILEVLETAPLRITDSLQNFMKDTTSLGFRWALDDYGDGDGHHRLKHIKELPLAYVKLDNQTSLELATQKEASAQTQQTLKTCQHHDIQIVAENISTAEQIQNLEKWHAVHLTQTYCLP